MIFSATKHRSKARQKRAFCWQAIISPALADSQLKDVCHISNQASCLRTQNIRLELCNREVAAVRRLLHRHVAACCSITIQHVRLGLVAGVVLSRAAQRRLGRRDVAGGSTHPHLNLQQQVRVPITTIVHRHIPDGRGCAHTHAQPVTASKAGHGDRAEAAISGLGCCVCSTALEGAALGRCIARRRSQRGKRWR